MTTTSDDSSGRLSRELLALRRLVDAEVSDLYRVLKDTPDAVAANTLYNAENGKRVSQRSVSKYVLACKRIAEYKHRRVDPALFAPQYWRQLHADGDQAPVFGTADRKAGDDGAEVVLPRLGSDLDDVLDPFDLEVHHPITVAAEGDPARLPIYVPRAHDRVLADLVTRAQAGTSAMAVLVAGSSTGKTRALWEALAPLRAEPGWRLWHPQQPTRQRALQEQIAHVGARTVLWLNETQRYFEDGSAAQKEEIATALRVLLADDDRAPVLILGTLWREHYRVLGQDPGSPTRILFDKAKIITVPSAFTGADLDELRHTAARDPRLKASLDSTEDGRITQYLAGGPELVDRYEHQVSAAACAVIEVAMDARRMGHRNMLPYMLLRDAAAAYLSDTERGELGEGWFEQALKETSRSCKGASGPVTPIRPHPLRARGRPPKTRGGEVPTGPMFQLADFLDQYGREHRAEAIPPIEFWQAVALYSPVEDQFVLGTEARVRGLHRDAAQLWKNASDQGEGRAMIALVHLLRQLNMPVAHLAMAAATAVPLDERFGLSLGPVLHWLYHAGAHEEVAVLADRVVIETPLHYSSAVGTALMDLHGARAHDQLRALADRIASHAAIEDGKGLSKVLGPLRYVGAQDQLSAFADRVAQIRIDDIWSVDRALRALHQVGAQEQALVLAERVAVGIAVDSPAALAVALRALHSVGAHEEAKCLSARIDPDQLNSDDPRGLTVLLHSLSVVHAEDLRDAVFARVDRTGFPLEDPTTVALLLLGYLQAGRYDKVAGLLNGLDPVRLRLDDVAGVDRLLHTLQILDLGGHLTGMLSGFAAHVPVHDTSVMPLLKRLQEMGAHAQAAQLAGRVAAETSTERAAVLAKAFEALHDIDAHESERQLAARVDPARVEIGAPEAIARIVQGLRHVGAIDAATAVAERAASELRLDVLALTAKLLDELASMPGRGPWERLRRRLPAGGQFDLWVSDVPGDEFRFGREPDGTPATAWAWEDLT
ncbi:hypothetical protein ACFV4K_27625 [Nocardia sp. NPDC059764]|uniref:hypothetical protein n=1 Tax=Nocardia sp. NPDC059764 TaxID=3346939 RepID=UPI003649A0B9